MENKNHPHASAAAPVRTPAHRPRELARRSLFILTVTAAMVALSVILCRFLGYSPQNSVWRFDFGFLPIALLASYFGPVAGAVGYMLADLIGSYLNGYAPNILILLCNGAFGAVMGLFFYRKKITLPRVLLCFAVTGAAISGVLMSFALAIYFGNRSPFALMPLRFANAGVNFCLRVPSFYLLSLALDKPLARYRRMDARSFSSYANSFQAVTVPGLERIRALLSLLGDPQEGGHYIHVAGTNGKGSVCAYLTAILTEEGYRVGHYLSPNLIRVNERISVAGEDIPDAELHALLRRIEPLCRKVKRMTGGTPTQFEIWTAAAFCYFKEKQCDYVVLEVGLGGEYDATNIIAENEIAVITRLGMDHMNYLGNTLAEIAHAKCGILKKKDGAVLVTVEQEPEAMAVIRKDAADKGVSLSVAQYESLGYEDIYEHIRVGNYDDLVAGIPGYCQAENAALAVTAAEELGIGEEAIRSGLAKAVNPARFERLSVSPTVIYDGGHNENGIASLVASLSRYYGGAPKNVIFACMKDKEIEQSLKLLGEGDTRFFFTEVKDNPRGLDAQSLLAKAQEYGIDGTAYPSVRDALLAAVGNERITIVCGSLYLYKDVTEVFRDVMAELRFRT